ncbi:MAG: 30S ribosomal protein S6 [Planctomycetes bacterium]|nr:30S ribosomal protein S6 [Planctomycetota bacterium]
MRQYETTILVRSAAARADYDGTVAAVRGMFESEGAQFSEFDKWEERKLAYPIAGETTALYLLGYLTADPLAIDKINRRLQLSELVLRHLTIARDGKALEAMKEQRKKAAEAAAAAALVAQTEMY